MELWSWKDFLPDVVFHMRERDESLEGDNPFKWVRKTTGELFGGKKVVIFGLPGAFTPTCTNEQLPGFDRLYQEFVDAGVDEIWCTSVNDAFSMYQWAKQLDIKNVKMLPDGNGEFAEELGVVVKKNNLGFGKRSWRHAVIVNDLVIVKRIEEDGLRDNCPTDPYENTTPENILSLVRKISGESRQMQLNFGV